MLQWWSSSHGFTSLYIFIGADISLSMLCAELVEGEQKIFLISPITSAVLRKFLLPGKKHCSLFPPSYLHMTVLGYLDRNWNDMLEMQMMCKLLHGHKNVRLNPFTSCSTLSDDPSHYKMWSFWNLLKWCWMNQIKFICNS